MLSLKSIKTLLGFVLLGIVSTWIGCSDSAPVASRPAGKATCSLCEFLGDDTYTATDGLPAPESPDTTQTDAEADSTQTDADADSTQSATVEFADANLERAVREALDRPSGPLTPADLAALTELDASYKNIESVAGLEHATALHTLYLRGNAITDVQPLARLTNLQTLSLWGNKVADASPLASLIRLRTLDMWGNAITDVSPLARLTNLQWIQLGDNDIADVSPLASLTNLQWLGVMENALSQHAANQQLAAAITSGLRVVAVLEKYPRVETAQVYPEEPEQKLIPDANLELAVRWTVCPTDGCPPRDITPADLASLTLLRANSRSIADLTGLEHATALETLELGWNNSITDLRPLANLTSLTRLELRGNSITSVSALGNLTNLTYLSLRDNQIVNVSALGSLTNLTYLSLRDNQIVNVSALGSLTNLTYLSLRNNRIVNVSALGNLTNLTTLNLHTNRIVNVSALGSLTSLTNLSLTTNRIVDISPLLPIAQAQGALVSIDLTFNPLSQTSHNLVPTMRGHGANVERTQI